MYEKTFKNREKLQIFMNFVQNTQIRLTKFYYSAKVKRDDNQPQLLSFSYNDIITKDIRMKLC